MTSQQRTLRSLVFDIETDGLENPSCVHCIVVKDLETGETLRFNDQPTENKAGTNRDAVELLLETSKQGVLVAHNGADYDIPVLEKLYGVRFSSFGLLDTRIMAATAYPDVKSIDFRLLAKGKLPIEFKEGGLIGSHSLKAWGYRLGKLKGSYNETADWQAWSKEMEDYCVQDVEVTAVLYKHLQDSKRVIPMASGKRDAYEMESAVRSIIHRQFLYGWKLDLPKALELQATLKEHEVRLVAELRKYFKGFFKPDGVVNPKRTQRRKCLTGHAQYIAGCPYTKVKWVDFNPGSGQHIVRMLTKLYGWEPSVFTASGEPSTTEEVLSSLPYPEAPLLCEYALVSKRLSMLSSGNSAILKAVGDDGRVHGSVNSIGARTRRMTHSRPNVAQTPSSSSLYGGQFRELYTVDEGYLQVGCDAANLELRGLGHYLYFFDGGEYANAVSKGRKEEGTDAHTRLQKAIGLNSRDSAKTWVYAYIYGAGDLKLGLIWWDDLTEDQKAQHRKVKNRTKFLMKQGQEAVKKVERNIRGLSKLKDYLNQKLKERGYIYSLDGTPLFVEKGHTLLNTLLQSFGAIVMKRALVIATEKAEAKLGPQGESWGWTGNIHDELQAQVPEGEADWFARMLEDSIREAGEYYHLHCPLKGESKVGRSWKDTH